MVAEMQSFGEILFVILMYSNKTPFCETYFADSEQKTKTQVSKKNIDVR